MGKIKGTLSPIRVPSVETRDSKDRLTDGLGTTEEMGTIAIHPATQTAREVVVLPEEAGANLEEVREGPSETGTREPHLLIIIDKGTLDREAPGRITPSAWQLWDEKMQENGATETHISRKEHM